MRVECIYLVYELAKNDDRVVFIGSDVGPDTLLDFKREMPKRFFIEGISEQHIIGMASGLAMEGYIPFINTITTFITRRCFEQIVVDMCMHDIPVRLLGYGGGLCYAPLGPTHLACDDIGILRTIPNMTIISPCDANEATELMRQSLSWPHPVFFRLSNGGEPLISTKEYNIKIGKPVLMKPGKDVLIISTGILTHEAIQAANMLSKNGIDVGILHVHTIKPIDSKAIIEFCKDVKLVVTVEEHYLIGGLGSCISEIFTDNMLTIDTKLKRLGIPDSFAQGFGTQNYLLEKYGLNANGIVDMIKSEMTCLIESAQAI